MTFEYRFVGENNFQSGITEQDHKEGMKTLKRTFPSAKVTIEKGTWKSDIAYIEYKNTDIHTLNRIVEKEVMGAMTKTDELRGKYLPTFTLRSDAQLVSDTKVQFMYFEDLPFEYPKDLWITIWDSWIKFVELELAKGELQKLLQKKEDITYGDKILTLLKNEPSQALMLLDAVQDDLTKAELGVISETINTYIRTLSKSFVIT